MDVKCIKILAQGYYKSYVWFLLPNGETICLRASREVYDKFRKLGVPTSQGLRSKK